MIKRIITFVLCVALCVSCIAIGVINQKADEAGAVAGAIGGAGNGTVDNISVDGETTSLLTYNEETKEYELGGDIVINADNADTHATYQELLALVAQGGVTINGMDKTITTDRPLFESITNVTIKNLNIDGAIVEASNARIGALARSVTTPFTIGNVTNNANISYVGAPATAFVGGLVGTVNGVVVFDKCVNNGNITIDVAGMGGFEVGGLVGQAPNSSSFAKCVNRGNITLGTSTNYSWVGGIIGRGHTGSYTNFWDVLNAGDITVKHSAIGRDMVLIGGIIGHQRANQMEDAINLGDINLEYTGTAAASANIAGIIGRGHYTTNFTRCINAGDIKVTGNVTSGYIGGISPQWYNKGGNSTFNDCISIGTITAPTGEKAPITPFYHSVSAMRNCYVKAFDGIKGGMAVNINDAFNNLFVITLPENIDTLLDNIAANGVTDGAAVFSAILAGADYDANYAHDQDDGMFLTTVAGLTVTADAERNNYFTTAIDKGYLDALKAIAGSSVEIGAIIAPATYVTKIGEFSHEAFDAYYTANKTAIDAKVAANGHDPITALYMTAAFGDGADFTDVEGVYNAGIYLKGAYETAYAARMYVKIGDAYVYSK